MPKNTNIISNANDTNSFIYKSNNDFVQFLFFLLQRNKNTKFKLKTDIYKGSYDKKQYPFVHSFTSLLLLKILNNMNLQCPFWKNNIKFTKSITDYKVKYKLLSGIYSIAGNGLPNGFDLACIVSTVPSDNVKDKMYPYTMMKKVSEHFNVIILKSKCHHLCFTFSSIVCKSGLNMKTSHLNNRRLVNQITSWKSLAKKKTISKALCYSISEVPSLTLYRYLQRNAFELSEWNIILFQIAFTMCLLQKEIPGFVHHNLTPKHIYLKKVPKGGQFVYKIGKKRYYVPNCGYIVKILPSIYSYANKLYENDVVYNEELQVSMGLNSENTGFYDFHLFLNTLYHTRNVPDTIKANIRKLLPSETISNKNSSVIVNHRLRKESQVRNNKSFRSLLKSDICDGFKGVHKNKIVFYPQVSL